MSSSKIFWSLIVSSQLCGLTAYALMQSWLHKYNDGFDWNSEVSHLIQNYHALFMLLGFLLLFGEATLTYRLLSRVKAPYLLQKAIHATILIIATILWVVGLVAAFKARNLDQSHGKETKHFYSFHSWLGLILMVIFVSQVLECTPKRSTYSTPAMKFLWFAYSVRISSVPPSKLCFAIVWYAHAKFISPALQALYQSIHIFNGLFLFVLATATCFTGLNEVGIYKVENYKLNSSSGIHLNMVGIFALGFVTTVGYLLWKPEFKLTPAVGEVPKESANSNCTDEAITLRNSDKTVV